MIAFPNFRFELSEKSLFLHRLAFLNIQKHIYNNNNKMQIDFRCNLLYLIVGVYTFGCFC